MSQAAEKIEEALTNRLKKLLAVQQFVAVVKEVDQSKYTCDVQAVDDSPIHHDVRYKTTINDSDKGVIIHPAKGSFVICSILDNDENSVIISKVTEFDELEVTTADGFKVHLKGDEMKINGDQFGGLVKAPELKTQVDKNTQILDTFKQLLQTPINEPGLGAPSAFQAALNSALAALQTADLSNIENEKIKHG